MSTLLRLSPLKPLRHLRNGTPLGASFDLRSTTRLANGPTQFPRVIEAVEPEAQWNPYHNYVGSHSYDPYLIFVRVPTGTPPDGPSQQLELFPCAPDIIDTVKHKLEAAHGFPQGFTRLIFAGKVLENGRSLGLYGVQKESTLIVLPTGPGGHLYPLPPKPLLITGRKDDDDADADVISSNQMTSASNERRGEARQAILDDLQQLIDRESDAATRKGFHVWHIHQGLSAVDFIIEGPPGSFYQGGQFVLRVWFPEDYPKKAFACCMLTPVYHPTVTPDGRVAFPRAVSNWFELLTVAEYLEHLHDQLKLYDFSHHPKDLTFTRLLECPEAGQVVNEWMIKGEREASRKARAFVRLFALPPDDDNDHQRRLSSWGFVAYMACLDAQLRQDVKVFLLMTAVDQRTGEARYGSEARLVAGLPGELQLTVVRHLVALHCSDAAVEAYEELSRRADGVRLPMEWRRHTITSLAHLSSS